MGEVADRHVQHFSSGRWGLPIPPAKEYPKTTKEAIADQRFSIVEVVGGNTNRIPGTKLVVCENTADTYWVWTAHKVTGIAKNVCKVIKADLDLATALRETGRKPYLG